MSINKGGRPPKTTAEKRSERITLNLTKSELETIKQKAGKSNLMLPDYLRRAALKVEVNQYNPNLITALSRIGANLNQLTKRANSGHVFSLDGSDKKVINEILNVLKSIEIGS